MSPPSAGRSAFLRRSLTRRPPSARLTPQRRDAKKLPPRQLPAATPPVPAAQKYKIRKYTVTYSTFSFTVPRLASRHAGRAVRPTAVTAPAAYLHSLPIYSTAPIHPRATAPLARLTSAPRSAPSAAAPPPWTSAPGTAACRRMECTLG